MRLGVAVALVVMLSGCYMEASGSYYPVVNGGPRVANTGYGFALMVGINLKYGRVRGQFGAGGEVVAADYEDETGKGKVGHLAGWNARADVRLAKLSRDFWGTLSVGGNFGRGIAAVEYEKGSSVVTSHINPAIKSSVWSMYAGPSLHLDEGIDGDLLFTVAPIFISSKSTGQDPFKAYGVSGRFTFGFIRPPALGIGDWKIFNLFRHGRSNSSSLERDMRRHNRNQGRHNDRARERRERERRERERKCRQRRDC